MKGLLQRATPGSGKSTATPAAVFNHLSTLGGDKVAILASPTRSKAMEWEQQAKAQGIPNTLLVFGRDADSCKEFTKCRNVSELGYEPAAVVCAKCPFHPERADENHPACRYLTGLAAAAKPVAPTLVFCCYESVTTIAERLPPNALAVIVLDEDPSRMFVVKRALNIRGYMLPTHDLPMAIDVPLMCFLRSHVAVLFKLIGLLGRNISEHCEGEGRSSCALLYQRLEKLLAATASHLTLADLLSKDVEDALQAYVNAVRNAGTFAGVYRLSMKPRPWMVELVSVMRAEYGLFKAGKKVWNHRIIIRIEDGEPILELACRRELPACDRVLVLDATGSIDRLRQLMPEIKWAESEIAVQTEHFTTVHILRSASRSAVSGPRRTTILSNLTDAITRFAPAAKKILLVSYGSKGSREWEQELREKTKTRFPNLQIETGHFGELRGSNRYEDCDTVVTIGDNEPPPFGLLDSISAFYVDDPEPLRLEQEEYAGHRRFVDARVRAWAEQHTVEELAQVAFRHRPSLYPGRVYIHMGNYFPDRFLGRPTHTIDARMMLADIAKESMRRFHDAHGWLTTNLLMAVGYMKPDGPTSAEMQASLALLRTRYGTEFTPLPKPYGDRQLRTLRKSAAPGACGFTVCLHEVEGRVTGWGDRERFRSEWLDLQQSANASVHAACVSH